MVEDKKHMLGCTNSQLSAVSRLMNKNPSDQREMGIFKLPKVKFLQQQITNYN